MSLPLVLVHGYSSNGDAFDQLLTKLAAHTNDVRPVNVGNYRSLTNDLTIKDIGRGFERALAIRAGLAANQEFDAIVHSTGMLVVRTWLTGDPSRRARLKHLVGIAPATWGSPLAHKGRSWLGAIFKGNRQIGPDFLAAGNQVLDGLELGSSLTWQLAMEDLFGSVSYYGPDADTPYVFIFVGNSGYTGLSSLVNQDGTDGTVRWAGVSLNSRKITIDLTPVPSTHRFSFGKWQSVSQIPVVMIKGVNHGTILSTPDDGMVTLIADALAVNSKEMLDQWCTKANSVSGPAMANVKEYQQFVIRAVDSRGDPVEDYNAKLCSRNADGTFEEIKDFEEDVHAYGRDPSYRCFHVELSKFKSNSANKPVNLWLQIIATSGSPYVTYQGILDSANGSVVQQFDDGVMFTFLDISQLWNGVTVDGEQTSLFYPYTTTLIDLRLHRETLPLDLDLENTVYRFGPPFPQ